MKYNIKKRIIFTKIINVFLFENLNFTILLTKNNDRPKIINWEIKYAKTAPWASKNGIKINKRVTLTTMPRKSMNILCWGLCAEYNVISNKVLNPKRKLADNIPGNKNEAIKKDSGYNKLIMFSEKKIKKIVNGKTVKKIDFIDIETNLLNFLFSLTHNSDKLGNIEVVITLGNAVISWPKI